MLRFARHMGGYSLAEIKRMPVAEFLDYFETLAEDLRDEQQK